MRSRTPSMNGFICPSPYGSMHKKVTYLYPLVPFIIPLLIMHIFCSPHIRFYNENFSPFLEKFWFLTKLCLCFVCDAALFGSNDESWFDSTWLRQKKPCSSRGYYPSLHLQLFDGRANNGLPTETNWSVWSPTQIAAFPSATRWINCIHNDVF